MKKELDRRDFIKGSVAAAGLVASAALCPREGGAQPAQTPSAIPKKLADEAPPELLVLNRLTFGQSHRDIERFQNLDANPAKRFHKFVEEQTAPAKIDDTECDERIKKTGLDTLSKSLPQLWADHVVAADKIKEMQMTTPKQEIKKDENRLRLEPANQLEVATWIRAVYSKRQLGEVLVDFWHDHFSVFAWDQKIAPVFVHFDRDVIRKNAWGNFRDMIEATTKSPAMLIYLDNAINQSANPNENYARELFELHTLGAENYLGTMDRSQVPGYAKQKSMGYVDGDVYEAARCFTGWRIDSAYGQGENTATGNTGNFEYFEPWHDRNQKIVLGRSLREYQPPMKDGHDVLDIIAAHPGTSRFICRKLCRRFISDNPPQSIVDKAAAVFRRKNKAPDQLKQVVKTILYSEEFKNSRGQKMRRPFEGTVALLRAVDADFNPNEKYLHFFERTGHRPWQWRTPDGYPDVREKWGSTNSLLERWRIANQIFLGHVEGIGVNLVDQTPKQHREPAELVAFWGRRLLGSPLPPESARPIEEFLAHDLNQRRLSLGVAMISMTPEFHLT